MIVSFAFDTSRILIILMCAGLSDYLLVFVLALRIFMYFIGFQISGALLSYRMTPIQEHQLEHCSLMCT